MRIWRVICVIVAAVAIVGCGGGTRPPSSITGSAPLSTSAPNQGASPVSDPQYQQCDRETNRHGEGYDSNARNCLWQTVSDGKPVEFTTTSYTTEGDPITYTIQALAPSHGRGPRFTVLVDSKDKFGKQGEFKYACRSIERVEQKYAAIERYSFRLSDCTGTGDGAEVEVP